MKKALLALTFSASLFSMQVMACDGHKASASNTSASVQTVSDNGAKCNYNVEACAKACEASGNKACAKACREQMQKTGGAASNAQVVVVNNKAAGKTCSGNNCMGMMAGALAAGIGLIGLSLFATKKL